MNNQPVVLARAKVMCPAAALDQHIKIQQHISLLIQEPEYSQRHILAAFRQSDLKRLFGENQPREFYLVENNAITYVGMKGGHDTATERFGVMIALNQQVLEVIFGDLQAFIDDQFKENPDLPVLRMTLLSNPDLFAHNTLAGRLTIVTNQEFAETNVLKKWDYDMVNWTDNVDPIEPEVEKPRVQLKDIPLTTRAGRQLVRNTIEENRDKLEELYKKWEHVDTASFDQWMTEVQGVHMKALHDLEGIDALPDDEYVEAMVTFKKAEAQAYHSAAVKEGKTDMHLFDWVKLHFGEEFENLGRAAAIQELSGLEGAEEADLAADDNEPAVFLVSFDGTIVENQRPNIGPESPYAIGVLKALQKNGHRIFLLTFREGQERQEMLDFLNGAGCNPEGTCRAMWADGVIRDEDVDLVDKEKQGNFNDTEIDYLIDYRQFGMPNVQISGKAEYEPTVYWGDLVQNLHDYGYLTEEDVAEILDSLQEAAEQQ
jgi:hypothetical protein